MVYLSKTDLKEIKQFRGGGLDKDSAPEDIAPNDVAGGYNVRFTGTEEGEEGYATDIESNELITTSLPAGINKGIGAESFESERKGYCFKYNSLGYHTLNEFDYDSETETVIWTNKTDTGGEDILPLNPQYYVNDLRLIQGKYLVFTDSVNEVGYINVERLKSGELGTITKDDIRLIKRPSLITPTASFGDDASRSVNLLKGNMFQFIGQYVYLDDEKSAWSSISKREVYIEENTPVKGTDVGRSNNLIVSVDAGSNRVKTINVGARIGMLDFMLIKSISRAEVLAIENDTFATDDGLFDAYDPSLSGVYEVYNESTNTYSFAFYNDGLYPNIDVLETDLYYDHIPQKAGALEVLNGNVLALADLTEGYERPTVDIAITQTSYDPNIGFEVPVDSTSLKMDNFTQQQEGGSDPFYRYYVYFSGIPQTGDTIRIVTKNHLGETYNVLDTATTVTEDENLALLIKKVATSMPYPTNVKVIGSQVRLMFSVRRLSETPDGNRELMPAGPKVTLALAGTGESKSIHSIKTNSSYQLALSHKDRYGRYFPIVTDKRFIVKTRSLAQLEGQLPRFTWAINETQAPTGAESYQWLISENTTHQSNLYVNAVLDTTNTDDDYLVFKINSLQKFNENNTSSILAYDYTAGDRCTFVSMQPAVGDKIWFNEKAVDVEVVEYKPVVTGEEPDPIVTDYKLKVRKTTWIDGDNEYNGETIEGRDILIEIYTPKKRTSEIDGETTYNSTLFYEIGEEYPIVNGEYSQLTGDIDEADVYFKTRMLVNAVNDSDLNVYEVEDFHFSDFYQSNYTSYGRYRAYDDETGQVHKKACIRYSDEILVGQPVNGVNRFFKERIYGESSGQSSANYGAINKIFQRDNYLICIQETKLGHIPIYAHILEDNEGATNVAISDKILGSIRYISSGSYGMGGAKESFSASPNGTVYFIDYNNCLPIRDGFDGVKEIGGKLTKYWKRILQQAKNAGKKVIGIYDRNFDEWIVTIEGLGDIVTTIRFSPDDWVFTDSYEIDPSTLVITGNSNGTASVNTSTGIATFTPTTDYMGNAGFSFSFVDDSGTITKNACGVVEAGSKEVDDFFFLDLIDKEINTIYESNAILINGNEILSPISISGTTAQYQINGGAWTSTAGTVASGDIVIVRLTTSGDPLTTRNATLTIDAKSDTFSVKTKSLITVPVSYEVEYGVNPITHNGLIFRRNSVEVARIETESSGTLTGMFYVEDVIEIVQISYDNFPWEDSSNANLTIEVDAVEVYNDDVTVQALGLQSDSFTIATGTVDISAVSTGSSSAVGYLTKILTLNTNTVEANILLTDLTEPKTVLYIDSGAIRMTADDQIFPYNLFTDANTQTLRVDNLSGSLSMGVTVNGGSVVTIPASSFHNFTSIVKDSINVSITM